MNKHNVHQKKKNYAGNTDCPEGHSFSFNKQQNHNIKSILI